MGTTGFLRQSWISIRNPPFLENALECLFHRIFHLSFLYRCATALLELNVHGKRQVKAIGRVWSNFLHAPGLEVIFSGDDWPTALSVRARRQPPASLRQRRMGAVCTTLSMHLFCLPAAHKERGFVGFSRSRTPIRYTFDSKSAPASLAYDLMSHSRPVDTARPGLGQAPEFPTQSLVQCLAFAH